ncbi:MAG: DNA polymerase I [Lachnospiraceae bacterium]|nr:DNA polymerase I [Lachnospiraceae bacterium]
MPDKIMLLDGHSILNRAFYGLPVLSNTEGVHTNAVLGFLNIMFRYMEEEKPTYLLAAFDRKEPTFRHVKYKEYKGTRKPMPEELREQVPLMKEVLSAMEIPVVTQAGLEADDILGTIGREAEKENFEVVIVSGDRDLLQLATDHVKIKIPKTKSGGTVTEDYYAADVQALYGVTPKEFIDMKGLMGDASDNIPGVPGIGEKTAAKLIQAYHSIENAHEHIEEVKPAKAKNNLQAYYEQAIMSKWLATIKTDCELEYHFKDAKIGNLFTKDAYHLFKKLELKSLFKYFEEEQKEKNEIQISCTSDLSSMDQIVSEIIEEGRAGLGVIGYAGNCRGLSLTSKKKTVLLLAEGFVTENQLKDTIITLLEKNVVLDILDYKALLHFEERVREFEPQIEDIGIQAYLLNPLQSSYDFDDIARNYLDLVVPSRKEVCGKQSLEEIFSSNHEKAVHLAGMLSYVPYMAEPVLRNKIKEMDMESLYANIERPTAPTLYDMEKYGISVEKDALKEYGERLTGRISELETSIHQQAGKEFNINSPKQLGVILFEDLKMPFAKKTKTGYSTSADILEKLAPDYPIVSDILEYRQLTKLKSTYADGLAAFIQEDGKIHGIFHQKVTATGRLSSSDPNLQNIPIRMPLGRAIRKVFVPDPGYVFVSADYSQIELRVLAHMAKDQNLIDAYKHNADIHTTTASQVFGVPVEEVTPLLRRNAKAVNFGIVYGISAFGLSQDLNISRKEANEYIDRYFSTYPGIKKYLDGNVDFAKEKGYVTTLYGRIRPIPELSSSNFMQRSFGERAAMNSSIQGTAADIIKIAMVRVSKRLREEKLESRLILQIHDELLIETKKEEVELIKTILREEMMGAANLSVPLSIDIEEGNTWYEAK